MVFWDGMLQPMDRYRTSEPLNSAFFALRFFKSENNVGLGLRAAADVVRTAGGFAQVAAVSTSACNLATAASASRLASAASAAA